MLYFCYLRSDSWSSKKIFIPLYLTKQWVLHVNVYKYICMIPSCKNTLNIFILLCTCTKVCNAKVVGFCRGRDGLGPLQWIGRLNSYLCFHFKIFQVFQETWNPTTQEEVQKIQVNSERIFPYEWGLVYVALWYISRWNITLCIFSLSCAFLPPPPS